MTMAGGRRRVGVRRHEDQRRDRCGPGSRRIGGTVGGVRMVRPGPADADAALVRRGAARRHLGAAARSTASSSASRTDLRVVRSDRRLPRQPRPDAARAATTRVASMARPTGSTRSASPRSGRAGGGKTTILFYISGHGFGHASRDDRADSRDPRPAPRCAHHRPHGGAALAVRRRSRTASVEVQTLETDTGVVQIDSLQPRRRARRRARRHDSSRISTAASRSKPR